MARTRHVLTRIAVFYEAVPAVPRAASPVWIPVSMSKGTLLDTHIRTDHSAGSRIPCVHQFLVGGKAEGEVQIRAHFAPDNDEGRT